MTFKVIESGTNRYTTSYQSAIVRKYSSIL